MGKGHPLVNVFQTLLVLRLIEIGVMMMAAYWVWGSPPNNARRVRTVIVWTLIVLNLTAFTLAVTSPRIPLL
jgi:hypothetical protein